MYIACGKGNNRCWSSGTLNLEQLSKEAIHTTMLSDYKMAVTKGTLSTVIYCNSPLKFIDFGSILLYSLNVKNRFQVLDFVLLFITHNLHLGGLCCNGFHIRYSVLSCRRSHSKNIAFLELQRSLKHPTVNYGLCTNACGHP